MQTCEICERVAEGDALYWWATLSLDKRDPKRVGEEKMTRRELHICDDCWEVSEVWEDIIKRIGWMKNVVVDDGENIP